VTLSADEREQVKGAAEHALPLIEDFIHRYAEAVGVPDLFGIGVYDASDAGRDFEARGSIEERALAELGVSPELWGERRPVQTARGKAGASLRSGMTSGEAARVMPEAFREGDRRSAGGILGEVAGKPVAIGASGLRATEDEAMARLLLEGMKRFAGDYTS
jgi:hypothetical protein